MIAVEHVKRFRLKDVLFISAMSVVWFILNHALVAVTGPRPPYMAGVLIACMLMSFTVLVVQRAGTALLFYTLGSMLNMELVDIGPPGVSKVLAFAASGLLFEMVYLVLKLEFNNVQVDILLGTAVSGAFLPLLMILFLSPVLAVNLIVEALNLAFISFFLGVISSTIAFLGWFHLRATRPLLRFQYS